MNFEDLKYGNYIKWVANRTMGGVTYKNWNTFGKIISKTENDVVVMTYDDFKKTTLSKTGDAIREEISLAKKSDVSILRRIIGYVRENLIKIN